MINKTISYLLIVVTQFIICVTSIAQKKQLDELTLRSWPTLTSPSISNDGKYISFILKNVPFKSQTLVIQSIDGKWQRKVLGGLAFSFLAKSNFGIFTVNDSVYIINLGGGKPRYIPELVSVVADFKNCIWIGRNESATGRNFILEKIDGTKRFAFPNIKCIRRIETDDYDRIKLFQMEATNGQTELYAINLESGSAKVAWKGREINNFVVDRRHGQIAFSELSLENSNKWKIWKYKVDSSVCKLVLNGEIFDANFSYEIERIDRFSSDGKRIIINVREPESTHNTKESSLVNILTSTDPTIAESNAPLRRQESLSVDLETGRMIKLGAYDGSIISLPESGNDDWAVETYKTITSSGATEMKRDLISTINGERLNLEHDGMLSPDGHYFVCFDYEKGYYYGIDTRTKRRIDFSQSLQYLWNRRYNDDYDVIQPARRGIAGWTTQGEVFIYDEFDIWIFSLNGLSTPRNITQGYGRDNKIVFSFLGDANENRFILPQAKIILSAFGKDNKKNGFYSIRTGSFNKPMLLTMQSKIFYHPHTTLGVENGLRPLKAKDANIYLVQCMSAFESPNYFISKDFRHFKRITNLSPEANFNWLTTELHSWENSYKKRLQGILYKPSDFDPNKRYPIIFYYYRKLSDNLNAFLKPSFSDGRLNIPWYVSKGFLVFTPDIHYREGAPGESCLDAVTSAAYQLKKLPYVDSSKMGIQGISFGGFETNYLVTHTNIFAAACSSSGLSDLVSAYNSLNNGNIKQAEFEAGPYQIGGTLWAKRDEFINNSPIFFADKVTTPILLMHTKNDSTVPYMNALEFFLALRRLGKKVWFLSYDRSDHGVYGKNAEDFNSRMEQFFNYFLKKSSPPNWMKVQPM